MPINILPALQSSPAYKIGELQSTYQQLKDEGIDVINCTIGDPLDDTPHQIIDAVKNSISSRSFSQYPPYIGSKDLRTAIATSLNNEYRIQLDPNQHVISCNGTKEAIFSSYQLFDWSNNQTVMIPSLSYPVYQMAATFAGISSHSLPLTSANNFLPDLKSLSSETLSNVQLFWINSPHNPTTSIAPRSFFEQLLELAHKHEFLICSDECYNDLYFDSKPTSILEFDSDHWICFRSLSKRSHMTGYRSGAIITKNTKIMPLLKKMRSPMGVGTPSFIQDAAITAWQDSDHVIKHRSMYHQKRDKLVQALKSVGIDVFGANAGFYVWASSQKHSTSESLASWFLDRHILVTPGTVFGLDGNPYIRMVFCLTNDMIDKVCDRILK